MKELPRYDSNASVDCTIGASEVPDRIVLLQRMRSAMQRVDRTEHGMVLHFAPNPDVEADLRQFAIDEKRCCQFWGFAVTATGGSLTLRWDGPPAASTTIDRLEEFFTD